MASDCWWSQSCNSFEGNKTVSSYSAIILVVPGFPVFLKINLEIQIKPSSLPPFNRSFLWQHEYFSRSTLKLSKTTTLCLSHIETLRRINNTWGVTLSAHPERNPKGAQIASKKEKFNPSFWGSGSRNMVFVRTSSVVVLGVTWQFKIKRGLGQILGVWVRWCEFSELVSWVSLVLGWLCVFIQLNVPDNKKCFSAFTLCVHSFHTRTHTQTEIFEETSNIKAESSGLSLSLPWTKSPKSLYILQVVKSFVSMR